METPVDIEARDALQRDLVGRYQAALAAAGGDRTALSAGGHRALAELLATVERLIADRIHRFKVGVGNDRCRHGMAEARAECRSAVLPVVIERAAAFDARRCPSFGSWLGRPNGELARAIRNFFDEPLRRATGMNEAECRIVRLSHGAGQDIARRGGDPNDMEAVALETRRLREYRVSSSVPDTATGADRDAVIERKLIKSGEMKALRGLAELRQQEVDAARLVPFSEHHSDVEELEGGSSTGIVDDRLTRMLCGDLDKLVAAAVAARGEGSSRQMPYHELSEKYGMGKADIAAATASMAARARAAHAHYAYFAGDLALQFTAA